MRALLLIFALAIAVLTSSCSQDFDDEMTSTDHLLTKITTDDSVKNFTYISYDDMNRIVSLEVKNSQEESSTYKEFTYNNQHKIVKIKTQSGSERITYNLTYSNNTIIVKNEELNTEEFIVTLDGNNRISKVASLVNNDYVIYSYSDDKEEFPENEMQIAQVFSYDKKKHPLSAAAQKTPFLGFLLGVDIMGIKNWVSINNITMVNYTVYQDGVEKEKYNHYINYSYNEAGLPTKASSESRTETYEYTVKNKTSL
ncbi:hypothetical protein C3K47_17170 [Solitalea longa]|uniref:DUF4595 domain-containing protein n=1 Tax=Solitalea longa TaxID=2079460 RepID=A0A2S4ZY66_9SPHI|nr:hypothetical protein [Solitalea longa]POY34989.1 hypothetical protein C3K47_17170 [Solitalea longa]